MKRTDEWKSGSGSKAPVSVGRIQNPEQHSSTGMPRSRGLAADEVSIFYIWRVLLQSKWQVISIVLACVLMSTVYLLVATPVYLAETQFAPVSEKDSNSRLVAKLGEMGGLAALTGTSMEQDGKKNESIATLMSRQFTAQFIKDEKLLPVLFHDKWDYENQRWGDSDPEKVPTLEDAWELFDNEVRRLTEDRKTGLVTLFIEWEDPHEAARWANALVQRANTILRKKTITESEKAIGYLREQLRQTSVVELKQVVNELIESEMKEIILANITEQYAFRVIDPAVIAEEPFKPVKLIVLAVGILLGGLLGIVVALLIDFLKSQRQRTESREQC